MFAIFHHMLNTITSVEIFCSVIVCEFDFVPMLLACFRSVGHGWAGPTPALLWNGQTSARACACSAHTSVSNVGPGGQGPWSVPIGWFNWNRAWRRFDTQVSEGSFVMYLCICGIDYVIFISFLVMFERISCWWKVCTFGRVWDPSLYAGSLRQLFCCLCCLNGCRIFPLLATFYAVL